MSRADPQMSVRLPEDLKPRLVEAAKRNGRTINAEIVSRLLHSFADAPVNALPEGAIKAILETRELVGEMHQATKAQPTSQSKRRPAP
jgi:hypothetical protein